MSTMCQRDEGRLNLVTLVLLIATVFFAILFFGKIGGEIPLLTNTFGVLTFVLMLALLFGIGLLHVLWDVPLPKLGGVWTPKQKLWLSELNEQGRVALTARLAQANRISLVELVEFTRKMVAVLQDIEHHDRFPKG